MAFNKGYVKEKMEGFRRFTPLLRELVVRDIKVRYRHSALGLVWTVLNPLLMMVVITIVFSTLFKQIVGINFHEYLTRVRFQHALIDLALTTDSLTDIALRNGFADLKTFNARFRTTLQRTPAEYRAQLCPARVVGGMQRKYLPCDDPLLQRKLREYLQVGKS